MKRILLTGSSGFIGSALLKNLSEKYMVYFTTRKKIKKNKTLKNTIQIYFNSYNQLNHKLKKIKVDVIIHCATHYVKDHDIIDIQKLSESNLVFGNIILENTKKMSPKKFINFSTVWENYNGIKDNYFNLYSVYKKNFSNLIKFYENKNSKTKFLNFFISDTFGKDDKRKKIINILRKNYRNDSQTKIISSNLFLNLVNVEDIVDAIILAIKKNILSGDYNLINSKSFCISKIISKINSKKLKKLKIKWLSKKLIKDKIYKKNSFKTWLPKKSGIDDIINIITNEN